MALHRWLGAILITSLLGLAGCGKPPSQNGGTAATTTTTGSAPTTSATTAAPATTAPATATPEATAAATATASASGTPMAAASGTPAAGGTPAGGVEPDFANAEGMAGYEEVMAMTVPAGGPEAVARGKAVFEGPGNCVSCHGPTGKGDGEAGKALDPPPRNLHAKADFKYGAGPHGVYRTVFYGVDGTGMAPLEGVLTPEQIWDVVHYVETLQGT